VPLDLEPLVDSWLLALRGERKSKGTITTYRIGVRQFLAWCADNNRPAVLDRATVSAWIADLLDHGREGATATSKQLAVRRFSAWLAEEGEIPRDELIGLKAPKIDVKVVHPLTEAELKALIGACTATTQFQDRRDEAVIRLMAECGARAGEVVDMQVADLNLQAGTAVIRRGKGGKGRTIPIGPQTARAIDRYLRVRRTHRLASTPMLWLGADGKRFGYKGLWKALGYRARRAGIVGFHPHRLRHSYADRWLRAGGSEDALLAIAGWSRSDMLRRYAAARASERAIDEARRINLGDV
jgi:site-specific recombinase XerD